MFEKLGRLFSLGRPGGLARRAEPLLEGLAERAEPLISGLAQCAEPLLRATLPVSAPAPRPGQPRPILRTEIEPPRWFAHLPARLLCVDVETTGLHSDDRVVSFAGILLKTEGLKNGEFFLDLIHLIFDPGKKSHPRAEAVHGYSDWLLRHQNPFSEHVSMVESLIAQADLFVAHNAPFDLRFINAELAALGRPAVRKPVYCTMEGHRRLNMPGSASLSAIAGRLGLARSGQVHSALEDAWLAMMVYLAQHECPHRFGFHNLTQRTPTNLKAAPPMPEGPLPRRKRRVTARAES